VIAGDGTPPPADAANVYVPSSVPGGRPPHAWLAPGLSLYDRFGFGWTLLRLGPTAPAADPFRQAAAARGTTLAVCDLPAAELRDLYERDLVLIRPDQIIAWRGNDTKEAEMVWRKVTGAG
jgi:hypothetical protein